MGVVPNPTKSMLMAPVEEPAAVTFRVTEVAWESEPLVAVIVKAAPPTGVDEAVVIVRVELAPAEIIEEGLNEEVAPAGRPLTDKVTVPVNPPSAVVFTV